MLFGVLPRTLQLMMLMIFSSENGSLNGPYDSYMYNLQPNTTYYFRAYGEDCNGVFYGNELEFITLP